MKVQILVENGTNGHVLKLWFLTAMGGWEGGGMQGPEAMPLIQNSNGGKDLETKRSTLLFFNF
jgi:hypothetical protein